MAPMKPLTVPELADRYPHEWSTLSRQQCAFVVEYISTGLGQGKYNAVAACRVAYPKVKAPEVWAARLLVNRRIKKIIALHQGLSETESVLSDIRYLLKRSKRKNVNLDVLVAPWLRVAAALESLTAKESSNG